MRFDLKFDCMRFDLEYGQIRFDLKFGQMRFDLCSLFKIGLSYLFVRGDLVCPILQ